MKDALEFITAFGSGIRRAIASAVRVGKTEVMREFDAAFLKRSVSIFRARSIANMDFADRRLGRYGTTWMTPDEQALFRAIGPVYWRAVEKMVGAPALQAEGAPARRSINAGTSSLAVTASERRKRKPAANGPATGRRKNGE